ncbi:MAG: S-methyl-5'-thioinosine phosphorylase [Armatimonadota bacterium]
MAIGIIGGTGVYDLGSPAEMERILTPFGEAAVARATIGGREAIFLARHGVGHSVPPHRINYRANIWALHALGVREVVTTQAVGSLNLRIAPGQFVILSQFIDFTKARSSTFFDGNDGRVIHADVTHPYCSRLIGRLLRAGEFLQDRLHGEAVYACTEGPRFETAAEIHALRMLGADVVGMTNVPEVVLAREAGLCYAALCVVCNWGAGMTEYPLTDDEVRLTMAEQTGDLRKIIERFMVHEGERDCLCEGLGFGDQLPTM